jgi:hypothetical protein
MGQLGLRFSRLSLLHSRAFPGTDLFGNPSDEGRGCDDED